MIRAPTNVKFAIVGCFYSLTTASTTGSTTTFSTTGTTTAGTSTGSTTTVLSPTTTTMVSCTKQEGMNQPLPIGSEQVTFSPLPAQPLPADVNPTSSNPGVSFPSSNTPQINVTLDQPANLTVVYLPIDRTNQPSNVNAFTVTVVYPDNTPPQTFNSVIPAETELTTTTVATPTGGIFPPSSQSPQVDLPGIFSVPQGTTLVITITSTNNGLYPTGVCANSIFHAILIC